FIYNNDSSKIKYMTAYVIISKLISMLYIPDIVTQIGEKVISGDVAFSLLKPLNIPFSFMAESTGNMLAKLMIKGTILIIIFAPFIFGSLKLSVMNLFLFLTLCILNLIFINVLMVVEGLLTFVLLESWAISYATDKAIMILSGALIPLTFYPLWLEKLLLLTPFPYMYSYPIRILLGDVSGGEAFSSLAYVFIWIVISIFLLRITYNKLLKKTIIQGG
ncbi:MAG: ABC-2 family transporter protein, partial [Ruminiclostridium sp.]